MFDELVQLVDRHLRVRVPVVVAISGHGGAGKSTLADALAGHYQIPLHQVVRVDRLYAKGYEPTAGIFELHDWDTIFRLLKEVRRTNRLRYTARSEGGIESSVDMPRPSVVIFEGIRLIRPEVMPYVDVSIWIDCPLDVATRRAVARNESQGDNQAELDLWATKWVPEAQQYVAETHPEGLADLLYPT